jgi:hypothetical protein
LLKKLREEVMHVDHPIFAILFLLVFVGGIVWLVLTRMSEGGVTSAPAAAPAPQVPAASAKPTASGGVWAIKPWQFWSIVLIIVVVTNMVWHWIPPLSHFFHLESQRPTASSAAGFIADPPDEHATVTAPLNGLYDREDDAKAIPGNWGPEIPLPAGKDRIRQIRFDKDPSVPAPSPADVPWMMLCIPADGTDPYIWYGSSASAACSSVRFSSKTDGPTEVEYWIGKTSNE